MLLRAFCSHLVDHGLLNYMEAKRMKHLIWTAGNTLSLYIHESRMKIQWPLGIEMWAWPITTHMRRCRPQELRIKDQRGTSRASCLNSEDKPARIDPASFLLPLARMLPFLARCPHACNRKLHDWCSSSTPSHAVYCHYGHSGVPSCSHMAVKSSSTASKSFNAILSHSNGIL